MKGLSGPKEVLPKNSWWSSADALGIHGGTFALLLLDFLRAEGEVSIDCSQPLALHVSDRARYGSLVCF